MAKSITNKTVEIELYLEEEEARFLKGLLQNHLGSGEESSHNYHIRYNLFETLKDALERTGE